MSTLSAILVLALVFGGSLTLILVGTIGSGPTPARMAPIGLPALLDTEEGFQQRVCPCKGDWPLATNERVLSNTYFDQQPSQPDPRGISSMVPFFGQFIDHDIVRSEMDPEQGTFEIQMVPYETVLTLRRAAFKLDGAGCRAPVTECSPAIDASTVYGETPDALRDGTQCELLLPNGLLPLEGNMWVAGDPRVTEHAVLTALHTLFAREHNRQCAILLAEQPTWSETQRFWKARQIVASTVQHITYEEWLPALMGNQLPLLRSVPPKTSGTRIVAPFSVVAYRTGHSMIPNEIGPFSLPSLFFNTSIIQSFGVEPILQGAWMSHAEAANIHVIDGLREFMFSTGQGVIGEDLETRNLFRGRDVGMGTYSQLAQCYGQTPFEPPADEDSMIGLLSEPVPPGASLPPTVAHIIAEQFRRFRDNDPHFYTRLPQDVYLERVYSQTLAKVISDNSALENVPSNVFYT